MFGNHINELRLVVHEGSGGVKTAWSRVKQQKPVEIWHAGEQDLYLTKDDQVTAVNLSSSTTELAARRLVGVR